jgi:hypothetical protein
MLNATANSADTFSGSGSVECCKTLPNPKTLFHVHTISSIKPWFKMHVVCLPPVHITLAVVTFTSRCQVLSNVYTLFPTCYIRNTTLLTGSCVILIMESSSMQGLVPQHAAPGLADLLSLPRYTEMTNSEDDRQGNRVRLLVQWRCTQAHPLNNWRSDFGMRKNDKWELLAQTTAIIRTSVIIKAHSYNIENCCQCWLTMTL